jgi:hypothetical protein
MAKSQVIHQPVHRMLIRGELRRSAGTLLTQEASSWHQRFTQVCADCSLGNPVIYARWAGAMQFGRTADENARLKSAWTYLVDALQAQSDRLRHNHY